MSTERDSRLQWIYASEGEAQLRERYDVWAADYDRDLDDLKWSAPQAGAERCAHFAEEGAEILDAGCGTGLVGVALAALGYARIVGFDLSTGMLERSAERGVYAELHQGSLLDRLPFDDGRFGSVVSVGVFTLGHVDGSAFAELARVTRPGGHVSFTFRDDAVDRLGYREEQQRLIDSGVWELVDLTEPMALIHEDGEDILLRVWTWRVT
ncbi:MAG TPA: class I SAM-dependent methyltransferase [Ilumatobacteraceae bacterium]|jgi:predicted TPR repeat methyltransferase|nr:class I SAM-dependent methyltransferase [Ilumatobacteraceae bacterium]